MKNKPAPRNRPLAALGSLRGKLPKAKPVAPSPAELQATDEAHALTDFKAGVSALPPSNRADLRTPPPPPVPRLRVPEVDDDTPPAPARPHNPDALPEHWFDESPGTNNARASSDEVLRAALRGVTPITTDRIELDTPKPSPRPLQHERDEQAALEESLYAPTPLELRLEGGDELAYLREGMNRQLLRDLRRGRWVVQDAVDLHGCNRDEARDLLARFMAECRKRDIRCVRVIHGKGLGSPGREPVLKKLVAGWLMNYDDVLAYCQARVHDGGAGALIVLMRSAKR